MVAKKTAKKNTSKKAETSDKITIEFDKKHILYIIGILVLLVFAIQIFNTPANDTIKTPNADVDSNVPPTDVSDNTDDTTIDTPPTPPVVPTETPEVTTPPVEEDTSYVPEAGEIVILVGDTANTELLDVTLNSYDILETITYQTEEDGDYETDNARAGKTFLTLDITVTNKGPISTYIGSGKITLITDDKYTYEPVVYDGYNGLPEHKKIASDVTKNGLVVFEIPLNYDTLKVQYSFTGLDVNEKFASWFLN